MYKNVQKCTEKVYRKSVQKKCTEKVYRKSVQKKCTEKVYRKSVQKECTERVYRKSVQKKPEVYKNGYSSSELLKTELSKTPRDNVVKSKFALPDSMRRRTVYTPQAMDETKVQTSSITPISAIKRRNTMYVKANSTPIADVPDMNNSKSCDSILTPTNRPNFGADSITPLIQSLSKPHLDNIRNSSSKTLLDEYNNSFSSTKTPMTDKRRTIANITLDIIKQRLENINRNASFNQSTNDLLDESFESKSMTSTVVNTIEKPPITPTPISDGNIDPKKPLKRKLFAPPSLFPENSPTPIAVPKTDKKTVTQKRKRNDLPSAKTKDIEKTQSEKSSLAKKNISRRSTLLFEDTSMRKDAHKSNSIVSGVAAKSKVTPLPGLVFTSARKSQIDFISEAVAKLGKFQVEDKVGPNTTHLIAVDCRRTTNLLRGVIRGIWILQYDYILKSMDANCWLSETEYEIKSFSNAVEINRIERQAFGRKYRMDLYRSFDVFYLAPDCTCKNLKELLVLCYGKVTKDVTKAQYFITESYQVNVDMTKVLQLHPNWILDSISMGKVEKLTKYTLKSNL